MIKIAGKGPTGGMLFKKRKISACKCDIPRHLSGQHCQAQYFFTFILLLLLFLLLLLLFYFSFNFTSIIIFPFIFILFLLFPFLLFLLCPTMLHGRWRNKSHLQAEIFLFFLDNIRPFDPFPAILIKSTSKYKYSQGLFTIYNVQINNT